MAMSPEKYVHSGVAPGRGRGQERLRKRPPTRRDGCSGSRATRRRQQRAVGRGQQIVDAHVPQTVPKVDGGIDPQRVLQGGVIAAGSWIADFHPSPLVDQGSASPNRTTRSFGGGPKVACQIVIPKNRISSWLRCRFGPLVPSNTGGVA